MAISENAISQWVDVFQQVLEAAGSVENTKIIPNLEVVDDSPASLPAGYIIVRNDQGFYGPVTTVPGIVYTTGDLVNVILIKGTEPIAFQQGSASGGSNVGRVSTVYNSTLVDPIIVVDAAGNVTINSTQADRDFSIGALGITALATDGATGVATFGGDIVIDEFIIRVGDPNTFLRALDDRWDFEAGGISFISMREAVQDILIINEDAADMDIRVESFINANALFFEGSSGQIVIGSNAPPSAANGIFSIVQSWTNHAAGLFSTNNLITVTLSSNATAQTYRAENIQIDAAGTGDNTGDLTGLVFAARNTGSGNWTTAQAVSVSVSATSTGDITNAYGYRAQPVTSNAGAVIGDWRAFEARGPSAASGAITTAHGLYIAAQLATGVTTGYGVRQVGASDVNLFAGKVGIGATPDTAAAIFQIHGALGGQRHLEATGIAGTAVVIIPNGTPDVTVICEVRHITISSAGGTSVAGFNVVNGGTKDIVIGGSTFQYRVNADGSFDVRRTAGTDTATVIVDVIFR